METRHGRRWLRWTIRGTAATVVALLVAGIVVWVTKPWAPEVVVSDPAPTGRWVDTDGVLGHWYPAAGPDAPGAAVLVLGGSEGGIGAPVVRHATRLQQEGFSVLALSYFGAPGQRDALVRVPLETFDRALDWMSARPEVDPDRLGILGGSKGAEAALLVASERDDVRAVVAQAPSSVAWQGLDMERPWRMATAPASSWSRAGEPLPFVGFRAEPGVPVHTMYERALRTDAARSGSGAAIDVTGIKARVLLTCGGQDEVWPSCDMARTLARGATAADGPDVTVLVRPRAGHAAQGPPTGRGSHPDELARRRDWPRVVSHLELALGRSAG